MSFRHLSGKVSLICHCLTSEMIINPYVPFDRLRLHKSRPIIIVQLRKCLASVTYRGLSWPLVSALVLFNIRIPSLCNNAVPWLQFSLKLNLPIDWNTKYTGIPLAVSGFWTSWLLDPGQDYYPSGLSAQTNAVCSADLKHMFRFTERFWH